MNNNPTFDKDFAEDFMEKYGDIVEYWMRHTDPLKRGFAIMLKDATDCKGVKT